MPYTVQSRTDFSQWEFNVLAERKESGQRNKGKNNL